MRRAVRIIVEKGHPWADPADTWIDLSHDLDESGTYRWRMTAVDRKAGAAVGMELWPYSLIRDVDEDIT